jgi:hypothetical protein
MGGDHRHRRRRRRNGIWAAVVVLLVAAGVGIFVLNGDRDSGTSATREPLRQPSSSPTAHGGHAATVSASATPAPSTATATTTTTSAPGSTAAAPAPAEPALDTCRGSVARADQVLAEAVSGVENWNAHVQSRTDLLAGRLTREEVGVIWKRTRLAGPSDLARFNGAWRGFEGTAELCRQAAAEVSDSTVETCAKRVVAADRAVEAASVVIGDWGDHQQNMVAHAEGDLDVTAAQEQWVEAWKEAPGHIKAYRDAVKALKTVPPCPKAA